MSVWEATLWSLIRAAAVGFVVILLTPPLLGLLNRLRRTRSNAIAPLVLVVALPMLMPGLLVGYAYRPEGLEWVITPWKADVLHGVIAAAKTLPWAIVIASLVGLRERGTSEAAWEQTRKRRSSLDHLVGRWCLFWERNRGALVAGAAAALWTFGEAEVAALLQARGWTEWTFRKLAGGWTTADIAAALWPVIAINLFVVSLIWFAISRGDDQRLSSSPRDRNEPKAASGISLQAFALIASILLLVSVSCIVPVSRLLADAWEGIDALSRQRTILTEFGCTLMAASVGTVISVCGARAIVSPKRPMWAVASLLVSIPLLVLGMQGPMLASVVIQALPLGALRATVIPQYLALAAVLMPMAVVLEVVLLRRRADRSARFAQQLTRHTNAAVSRFASKLFWRFSTGPRFFASGFLFWSAFWDLQTAALLSPPGWATAPGRLYNLAHYGQSQTLAAMLIVLSVVAFAIPASFLLISLLWPRRW